MCRVCRHKIINTKRSNLESGRIFRYDFLILDEPWSSFRMSKGNLPSQVLTAETDALCFLLSCSMHSPFWSDRKRELIIGLILSSTTMKKYSFKMNDLFCVVLRLSVFVYPRLPACVSRIGYLEYFVPEFILITQTRNVASPVVSTTW